MIALWDVREANSSQPTLRIAPTAPGAHKEDVMSLSFNPYQEFLLLSGSVDKTVKLWDTRNTAKALHTFVAHTDEVLNGAWRGACAAAAAAAAAGALRRVVTRHLLQHTQQRSVTVAEL